MGKIKLFRCPEGKKRVSMGEIVGDIKILGVHGRKANKSDVSTEGKNNIFQYILLPCPTTAAAPSASASPPSRGDRQLRGLLLAGLFILFPITAVHRKKSVHRKNSWVSTRRSCSWQHCSFYLHPTMVYVETNYLSFWVEKTGVHL